MSTVVCRDCGFTAPEGLRCPKDGAWLVRQKDRDRNPHDPLLGQTVGDEFGVIGVLGRGGFGTVYRAVQSGLDRPVALKVMHPRYAGDTELRDRFFREAHTISKLHDETVVNVIRYGEDKLSGSIAGILFMALEYIPGRTLKQVLRAETRLQPARAALIAEKALRGLAEAHGLGIVHRDLKPDNLMLVRDALGDEQVKVLDFGIAKVLHGDDDSAHTQTGTALGTPRYMAPDQFLGLEVSPSLDIYSVGILLFEMLTGEPPFDGDTPYLTLRAHAESDVPPIPPELGIPADLEAVIVRALAKTPEKRFGSAIEMAKALKGNWGVVRLPPEPSIPPPPPPFDPESTSTHMLGESNLHETQSRVQRRWLGPATAMIAAAVVTATVVAMWPQAEPLQVPPADDPVVAAGQPTTDLVIDEPIAVNEPDAAAVAVAEPDVAVEPPAPDPPLTAYERAIRAAIDKQPAEAITALKRAIAEDSGNRDRARIEAAFDLMRDDARFKKLVAAPSRPKPKPIRRRPRPKPRPKPRDEDVNVKVPAL